MGPLINTFSWSPSRERLFRNCLRAYWLQYYGSWGGWDATAPPEVRRAYVLKQMSNLPMWAGSVLHGTIEGALRELRQAARRGPEAQRQAAARLDLAALQTRARDLMVQGWRQSRSGAWSTDPKRNLNLFEHYYREDEARTNEGSVRARDRIYRCLEHLCHGPLWSQLAQLPEAEWWALEELEAFEVDGVRIWVQLDLALQDTEGLRIIDWKSGIPKPEDGDQVLVYGLFAQSKQPSLAPEQVRCELHYLYPGEVQETRAEAQRLSEAADRIRASVAEMRTLQRDPEENLALREDHPLTEDLARCRTCRFKEMCGR